MADAKGWNYASGQSSSPVRQIVPALDYRSDLAFRRKFTEIMGATPANHCQLAQERAVGQA